MISLYNYSNVQWFVLRCTLSREKLYSFWCGNVLCLVSEKIKRYLKKKKKSGYCVTGFFLLGLLPHLVAFSWLPYTQLCNSYSIIKQVSISAVGSILWATVRCLTFHLRCKNQHLQHLCKYWLLLQWGLSCEATCSLREWHQEVQTISFKKTPVAFFSSPLFFLWHHPALATWRVPHYMKPWNFLHLFSETTWKPFLL